MYSNEIFADFPRSLPKDSKEKLKKDSTILNKVVKQLDKEQFNLLTEKHYEKLGLSKESYRLIENISFLQTVEKDITSVDFQQVLYQQEFISLFSYLEGYFQDVQRILFENDRSLLANDDKVIALNKILQAESYDKLISKIIDEKLEKSGYEKISSIIQKWKKEPFKIILKLKKSELEALEKFTCIRNIIVHNNSKINTDLIKYLDSGKYNVGLTFKLDSEIMKEYKDLIFEIIFSTYMEICSRYPTIIENEE
ncbi:hypothetical protein D1013_13655 [Euzebyella marina]|uniref:RiboL-PSP-HEPN domain-containing protein n=1 Tax=Euzebyella marina TaxID=1761453 RepID=A0A3G2L7W0_9FLAO|nr:hypothetical protein [Euzebyella marina]AYN68348.1 hypothetical protein D1013_13655 [Euzebyella marina]